MTIRDVGFLLVGFGIGLLFAFIAAVEMTRWMHHTFIFEVHWPAYIWMAVPWILLIGGIAILFLSRRRA